MIEEYLNNNYAVDEDTMIKINKILTELNTKIASEDIIRNINWKLKKFEFSNMFSYGEDNVVDFVATEEFMKWNEFWKIFVSTNVKK